MSSGTIFWMLLLIVGPLLMVFMHRGHGGHGSHGGGPATAADPRGTAGDDSSSPAGQGASEQEADGHRHRGC